MDVDEYTVPVHLDVQKTISMLQGIRNNESLKPRYEVMVNQCIVLLVSYFGSAVKDLFREGFSKSLELQKHKKVLGLEIKIKAGELQTTERPQEFVAEHIVSSGEISFQDMNSIRRGLDEYFGADLQRDETVNDVILAHACRHAIVHHGMEMDKRLVKQVSGATPRSLMPNVAVGTRIQFTPEEVKAAGRAMTIYVERVAELIAGSF